MLIKHIRKHGHAWGGRRKGETVMVCGDTLAAAVTGARAGARPHLAPEADHAARAADRLRQLARRLIQLLQVARRLLNFVTVVETALVHRLSKTPTLRPQPKPAQRQSGFR